jgi:hypothetical protein
MAVAKKLVMTIDAEGYNGLHRIVRRRRISRFQADPARRPLVDQDLRAGYAVMAADQEHEVEAAAWYEELVGDVADEPRRDRG